MEGLATTSTFPPAEACASTRINAVAMIMSPIRSYLTNRVRSGRASKVATSTVGPGSARPMARIHIARHARSNRLRSTCQRQLEQFSRRLWIERLK